MTTEPLTLRDLRPGDVTTLVEIAVAAWEPIYGYFQETMGDELFLSIYPDWRETKSSQIRAACDPDSRWRMQVIVAERGGSIVGFATFRVDENTRLGEISNNAVRPECRGQGIAPTMYEEVFARMRQQGMRFAKVHTGLDPSHAPARRAYAKAGFDVALPMVDYYREL